MAAKGSLVLMMRRSTHWFIITCILFLSAALRLADINRMSLRGDEAFTMIHWVREPLAQTLSDIATRDPQPPLAYALYRAWGLTVGMYEHTLRFLPALCNLIGTAALYALGSRIAGGRAGLTAAFLWAINPNQIWHAQDARNYAIWAAISPVALWLALRFLDKQRLTDGLLYIVAAVTACYLYYLELFVLLILTVYVVVYYMQRDLRLVVRWFVILAVIGAALSLWFLQGRLLFSSGYGGTAGAFDLSLLFTDFIRVLVLGDVRDYSWVVALIILVIIIVSLVLLSRSRSHQYTLLFTLLSFFPLLLLSAVSLRLNVFVPRYVLFVTVIYLVLIALYSGYRFGGLVLIFVIAFSITSLSSYFLTDYAKSPDWRALTDYLDDIVSPDAQIVQAAADEAYTFYHTQAALPSQPLRLPANPAQTNQEIIQIIENAANTHDSLWLIAETPYDWANKGAVEAWLNANMQRVRDASINGLPVREFRSWQVAQSEYQPIDVTFNAVANLVGSRVERPNDYTNTLDVWLYWQPMRQTDTPLKVFVHLVGAINPATGTPLWTQDDQEPQDGRANTTHWTPDVILRDVYVLPLDGIPPGTYQLMVGMYDPATNTRVTVSEQDSYPLLDLALE